MHRHHDFFNPSRLDILRDRVKTYKKLIADQERIFQEEKKLGTQLNRLEELQILLQVDVPEALIPLMASYEDISSDEERAKRAETIKELKVKADEVQQHITRIEDFMSRVQNQDEDDEEEAAAERKLFMGCRPS